MTCPIWRWTIDDVFGYLSLVYSVVIMQVLGAVHFEKCLPDGFNGISATTSRMALRDALINNREPSLYCQRYLRELTPLIAKLESSPNTHLRDQPIFEWMVGDNDIQFSPCWRWSEMET